MAIEIRDGAGSGRRAQVDTKNRIATAAVSGTIERDVSIHDGHAYAVGTMDTANTLTVTATGGPILYFQNTSATRLLIVEAIAMSNDTAGTVMVMTKNPILGTIGNENTHTPTNLNFSSGNTAEVIAYNWDEVGDGMTGFTGGTKFKSFILPPAAAGFQIGGAIVLGRSDSLMISTVGAAEFEVAVRVHFVDIE